MNCPHHPEIELPPNLTCPLCAQDRRRQAYAQQKGEMAYQFNMALLGLLKPATEVSDP